VIDLTQHAEAILSRALAHGGGLGEIFLEERASTSLAFEENKVENAVTGSDAGVGIRVLMGDRTSFAHTNDLSLEGLLTAADTVAAGCVQAETRAYDFGFAPERHEARVRRMPETVPVAEKLDLVRAANDAARAHDPRIVQAAVRYGDARRRIVIANSEGRFVEEERVGTILVVQVVAQENGVIQTGYRPVGGTVGFELFDDNAPEEVARIAARRACLMLEADPAPAGRMPVVVSSEAGGTLIHEAVGHGLEADHIEKGMSKYCDKIGERIASDSVTVVDDGTLPGKRGTSRFDDEGTRAGRTALIENGVLRRYMNDLRTARKLGAEPTGNGRRESYAHRPVPRMTNTLIEAGRDAPESILADTDHGLFVRKMGGGQVNPLNGDYVFEVSEGYVIKGGKAETPVRGATLIGNGPETLMQVEAVGNDMGFAIGTCGKEGQGVPVSDAQPTIRIQQLTIGGTGA
jgi:TldD protein